MDTKRKSEYSLDDGKNWKNLRLEGSTEEKRSKGESEVEYSYDFYTLNVPEAPDTTAKVLDKISKRGKNQAWVTESEFQRVHISELNERPDDDAISTCKALCEALTIRDKWMSMLTSDLCEPPPLRRRVSVMAESSENIVDEVDMLPTVRYAVLERTQSVATTRYTCNMVNGVTEITMTGDPAHTNISRVFSFEEFLTDFTKVITLL
jgi:hypothetical protein